MALSLERREGERKAPSSVGFRWAFRRAGLSCRPSASRHLWVLAVAVASSFRPAAGQFQFEMPAEMMQGMMGGGGGRQGPKGAEWPKTENSEIAPEYDWLVNTEWSGKTSKYLLLKDGLVESPLKECEPEGHCLWAANNGRVLINTPKLKVVKFTITGHEQCDRKKLENKVEEELKKVSLVMQQPGKNGKRGQLDFSRVAQAEGSDSSTGRDLFQVLDLPEDAEQAAVKSKFRRLSVQNHPDKGGDPKLFNEIREAYEVLSGDDSRRYYKHGGMQLVKNMENAWKEVEGQKAQLDAQLNQVPKNHPQYNQFKQQIDQQKKQFDGAHIKHEIEKKMQNDEIDVMVPVSAAELYNGVPQMDFQFMRLVMCRGCRDEPERPECADCGRCPPEKIQIPKYANTPFGRQVVAMREKEQESRERCREVPVQVPLRIAKGAKQDVSLKVVSDIGHQIPGKLPGKVNFKVQRGSQNDTYRIAEADLHTVLHVSLEQALFGFSIAWKHLGDEQVQISRERVTKADEVIRIRKKGLVEKGEKRGDLYVRLAVDLPEVAKGQQQLSLSASAAKASSTEAPRLVIEDPVRLEEGSSWREWQARQGATEASNTKKGDGKKSEL
eukprot:CAMPEP_0115118906 /NCGR_PEP_ID=MMETSP0227-20121206/44773_1 /TAXON_ID=89957 /ORGANISM="Polarella glacialis, Strain CCMP 1383" /LENGTH=609 /DNA_ID=CAMNT_0002520271 /DNA_START=84 /DNA_END=1913 /DNA_ORIENTATION=-